MFPELKKYLYLPQNQGPNQTPFMITVEPGTYSYDIDLGESMVVELKESGTATRTHIKAQGKDEKLPSGKWSYEKNILTLEWPEKTEKLDFRSYSTIRSRIAFNTLPSREKVSWRIIK